MAKSPKASLRGARLDLSRMARPLLIAHRGYSAKFPENTLAAFQGALDAGCHMIELDVTLTKDRRVVVIHDDILDRTTTGKGPVRSASLAQIKELDAGSWFSPAFSSERVPELGEVLDLIGGRVPLNIEIKKSAYEPHHPADAVERQVMEMVKRWDARSWVLISSFETGILERIAADKDPPALAVLTEDPLDGGLLERWKHLEAVSWNPRARSLSREQVETVHAAGCLVLPWTILTQADWERVLGMGADGAFCNDLRVGPAAR